MERKTKYVLPWIIYLGSLMGFGLAKFILQGIGVEFRIWVQALFWVLAFLFPALLIGYYLTRIKYKVLAVVVTVIYAVVAVIVFLAGFFYFLFTSPTEYDIGLGMICVAEQSGGYTSDYTYWDKISFFGRKKFEWDEERDIRLLEDKYGMDFEKSSGAYRNEKYPDIAVHILRYPIGSGSELSDDFIDNIQAYYFKKTYEEKGFCTKWSEEEENGITGYRLIVNSEAEMRQASKEAAGMIADAIEDPIFEKFTGALQVEIEVKGSVRLCSLAFGGAGESDQVERDRAYYTNADHTEKTLEQTYNELLDSLEESEMMEQIREDTDKENQDYFSRMESSYDFLYENELSKQYTTSEKMYNAKGNFYAVLGGDTAEYENEADRPYEVTVVYDRVSDDGDSLLFVMYKKYHEKADTAAGYSVNLDAGKVEEYDVPWY